MSGTKALLKATNDAIRQNKFDDALEGAEGILAKDPTNYQGHIFLAFALDKKSKTDEAEQTYQAASSLRPTDPQALQGLIKLYEKQGARKLGEYQQTALRLAELFRDADDMYRCQDVIDKFVDFARANGDRQQYVAALEIILPSCPIYPALEGRVPHPASTYETIAQIIEADEKKRINTLIGERRTRLGARIHEVTLEVRREVFRQSRLGYTYRQLIDWTSDDDTRRKYEEKLLQYCSERLAAFPPGPEKQQELAIVQRLADDMVIIKHPYKLAWDISIDWKDYENISQWDVGVLREYCNFFPDSDLYKVITGFLTSDVSPFPKLQPSQDDSLQLRGGEDESEDDDDGGAPTSVIPVTEEDRLLMMTDGISTAGSLLAYRLIGEYFQHLEEYESNVEVMRKAQLLLKGEAAKTGLELRNTADAFSLYLGTALVFFQSPRHHQEAKTLFDRVLDHDPKSTPAMIGVGLIYEEEEEYDDAIDFLERALQRDDTNLRVRTEAAWVKALKGDFTTCSQELGPCLPMIQSKGPSAKELLAQTQWRLGHCIWNIDTSKPARKNRYGAYAYFLDALKSNLNFAPAYTSLGVYYADYANDQKRARKCFQKAVELSPSEVTAAERLARSFADDGDWDRVELVAQRVVDSGKVKPPPGSKRKGISWPFSALGVAELNKQEFVKAIASFQAALRLSPEDYHSWVGLGESYFNSGRFIAATKATINAQTLEEDGRAVDVGDTWFTKFLLANIKRELGEFDDAIALHREVIESRPQEQGVAIALMQTLVDSAWDCIDKGFFGKSTKLATESIQYAAQAPGALWETFNFWKAVADSCSIFLTVQSRLKDFPAEAASKLIGKESNPAYHILEDVDGVGTGVVFAKGLYPEDERVGVDLTRSLHTAILAHKRAVHVSANDVHAQAVAYYNLGWAEHRGHLILPGSMRRKPSRYLKAATKCFKRAIELEPGNSEFWNSLGVVTSEINPAVSQHAFVRSLYINERSVQTWTNLGTLALIHNDLPMANDTYTRAQSTDPDYAHAWLGQGLVALLLGETREARGLFTHAMEISESSSLITRRQYSVSMFDHIASGSEAGITSLIQPLFALGQLSGLRPQDAPYLHMSTLFQERINDSAAAAGTLEQLCATVEADYEQTESTQSLARFALAKTDLARSYLAIGSYGKAVSCGEMALELSSDESAKELTPEERTKARLSAHLTLGLAEYYQDDIDGALSCFETALEESGGNADAVCVLAQVLWAFGTQEAKEKARDSLFEVLEKQPDHVESVLLLGVIALLDDDEEALEAVTAELQGLRLSDEVSSHDHSRIGEILQAVAALSENSTEEDAVAEVQTDILLYPQLPHGWSKLAVATGENSPADVALKVAQKQIPPRGLLGADDLSRAYAGTGKASDAQIGILSAPWIKDGWETLRGALEEL